MTRWTRTLLTVLLLSAAPVLAGCGDEESLAPPLGGGADGGGGGLGGGGGIGGTAGQGGTDPRFDPFAEALQTDLAASDAFGVSVAVMEGGVVTYAAAFGSKDSNGAEPLLPTTLMQIGSTTKQMTAAALLQKVEAGLVTLDDTLAEALPDLEFALDASWSDQLLVRHLLSHQGGLYDLTPWSTSAVDTELANYAYGPFATQEYLMNPPGAFWNYSNPNFILAGLITEELDGRMWPDLMIEDLYQPLGMDRTFLRKTEVEADGDYALSYGLGTDDLFTGAAGPTAMEDVPDPAFTRPAGLAWTTPTQMMAWAAFLMNGDTTVLSDTLRAEITTEHVDTLYPPGIMHYGYGMFVQEGYLTGDDAYYQVPVWQHGGNTLSFSNELYILPEQDFAVVITTSGYGTDFSHSIDVAITTLADLPDPSPAPEVVLEPSTFHRHVGTYHDAYNVGDIIITQEGDALHVEMPTLTQAGYQVDSELIAISSELFYVSLDGEYYDLTFVAAEPNGDSEYVRNRIFVATRVAPGPNGQSTGQPNAQPSAEAMSWWIHHPEQHAPGPQLWPARVRR